MTAASPERREDATWGRWEATLGVLAVLLVVALQPPLPAWQSNLLVWAPMLLAVAVAWGRRRGTSGRSIRFALTWFDVLLGAFVGLALRTVVAVTELLGVGHLTSAVPMVQEGALWVLVALVSPAIIAPVVEEMFFRGLVLPAIGASWLGIVGSAVVFSAVHLTAGFDGIVAFSTLLVGLATATLAVRTRRLGAPIVAHVVYNGSLVALSLWGGGSPGLS